MPTYILSVVPLCPMLFAISRIVFFKGYKGGLRFVRLDSCLRFTLQHLVLCLIIHED